MAPIDLIYKHLHNRIKLALDEQLKKVIELGDLQNPSHVPSALLRAHGQLQRLQDNYLFLEQVYKYHSLVEDEVSTLMSEIEGVQFLGKMHDYLLRFQFMLLILISLYTKQSTTRTQY